MSTPCVGAVFHLMVGIFWTSSERRGTIGACRYVEVLEGNFLWSMKHEIFRFCESEIDFRLVLHWTIPAVIPPGRRSIAEARAESRAAAPPLRGRDP
jgi:hypothetical protein